MQPQLIYLEFVIHGGSGSVPWQKKYNDICNLISSIIMNDFLALGENSSREDTH